MLELPFEVVRSLPRLVMEEDGRWPSEPVPQPRWEIVPDRNLVRGFRDTVAAPIRAARVSKRYFNTSAYL
jgi:hypothetical protein